MKPIVVVGSLNMDLLLRAERLPGPGETVPGQSCATHPGGKGGNQAVAAARLGAAVRMIGAVGTDSFGEELRGGLAADGVDHGAVITVPGPSGVALVQVEPGGENRITVVAGANAAVTPELLRQHRALVAGASAVLTQLETPRTTAEALAALCAECGVPLILDPAPAPAPAQPLSPALLKQCAWLTPNLSEAHRLLGQTEVQTVLQTGPDAPKTNQEPYQQQTEAEALARALRALGPRAVAVKAGAAGVVALGPGSELHVVPAFPVPVSDTTAAGDAWNAGLAVALGRGMAVREALRFASAAGALAVTVAGARPSLPTLAAVDRLLRSRTYAE